MTLPVAVALSTSLAVNRMARDGEMTTLRAAGQPLWRTFLPYSFSALCFRRGFLPQREGRAVVVQGAA
jgi:lipopolysaccharide export LptBFGC system permease protein LptF